MDIVLTDFSYGLYGLLFAVAFVAGAIDAIAGGGGLITVPVLLSVGLSPAEALATNKLQGCAGTLSASHHFIRRGLVDLKTMAWPIGMTAIGSVIGTLLVAYVDAQSLLKLIPFILICVAIFFFFLPFLQPLIASKVALGPMAFAVLVGSSIGFYDGFIGPGTGAFFSTAYLCFMGFSLLAATAHTKVLNATSNLASLSIFAFTGHIVWLLGLIMALGQWLGAQVGSRLAMSQGTRLIRPMVIVMCLAISTKLILDNW
jgi:uncharacterized membrane protein YfcA